MQVDTYVPRYLIPGGPTCSTRSNVVSVARTCRRTRYLQLDKSPRPAAGARCCFREGTIPGCWSRTGACANSTLHGTPDPRWSAWVAGSPQRQGVWAPYGHRARCTRAKTAEGAGLKAPGPTRHYLVLKPLDVQRCATRRFSSAHLQTPSAVILAHHLSGAQSPFLLCPASRQSQQGVG